MVGLGRASNRRLAFGLLFIVLHLGYDTVN